VTGITPVKVAGVGDGAFEKPGLAAKIFG